MSDYLLRSMAWLFTYIAIVDTPGGASNDFFYEFTIAIVDQFNSMHTQDLKHSYISIPRFTSISI